MKIPAFITLDRLLWAALGGVVLFSIQGGVDQRFSILQYVLTACLAVIGVLALIVTLRSGK